MTPMIWPCACQHRVHFGGTNANSAARPTIGTAYAGMDRWVPLALLLPNQSIDSHSLAASFHMDRRQFLDHEVRAQRTLGRCTDENLPWLGGHHQPRRQVDLFTQDSVIAAIGAAIGACAHLSLADPDLNRADILELIRQVAQRQGCGRSARPSCLHGRPALQN